jgi:hypothetical protein
MELLGNQDGQVRHLDMAHVLLGCLQNMAHGFLVFSLAAGVIWACEPLGIKMAGQEACLLLAAKLLQRLHAFPGWSYITMKGNAVLLHGPRMCQSQTRETS